MTQGHDAAGRRPSVLRGVLSDLSLPQVAGTALAAVTSMLLSSYIGIAGSIIGVAAASVVSTVCASLYKNFLAASAERIREIPQVAHGTSSGRAASASAFDGIAVAEGRADAAEEAARPTASPSMPDGRLLMGRALGGELPAEGEGAASGAGRGTSLAPAAADAEGVGYADDAPTASLVDSALAAASDARPAGAPSEAAFPGFAPAPDTPGGRVPSVSASVASSAFIPLGQPTATPHLSDTYRLDDGVLAARDARLRKARARRNVVIVAVVSALAAVALSGAAVWFFTMGEGLGAKPASVRLSVPEKTQAADDSAASKAADDQKDEASSSQGDAASSDQASEGDDGKGQDAAGQGTTGGGEGSDAESGAGGSSSGTSGDAGTSVGSSDAGSDASGDAGTSGSGGASGGSSADGSASGSGSASGGSASGSSSDAGQQGASSAKSGASA